jgi:hypothetical protein
MTKLELTKLFLKDAGIVDPTDAIIRDYLLKWWATPLSPIGLRLSTEGNKFLKQELKLAHYSYEIKEDTTKTLKLYLQLNKRIGSPYYLQGNNTIILYGETDASMIALMGGDIATYMDNFSR